MRHRKSEKLADVGAMVRVARSACPADSSVDPAQQRRQLVADLCRLLGSRISNSTKPANGHSLTKHQLPSLSPRMRQTLDRLLVGDSEKQIAARLGLSRHTVHVYVKALYKGFGVSSRGELLAKFVRTPQW
jgi:DNA-binding NarL/FixJ family response regulator